MAKQSSQSETRTAQRLPAELAYEQEINALAEHDQGARPAGWRLSPQAVRTFILGGDELADELGIERKIFGNDLAVERAIVTLAGQRGLMLVGEPGTAKSLLSELLAAAISGCSTNTVQGSAGLIEENIRYTWNYALLLKQGPSREALVPGPLHDAVNKGQLLRFEEITRCPTEVQDSLIPILSDKVLHIPELSGEDSIALTQPGFNIIATANIRDRGVNEMSAAIKRRFNFETMQPIKDVKAETSLITREVTRLMQNESIEHGLEAATVEMLVTIFNELRNGHAMGAAVEPLSNVLSTAEAINVVYSAAAECWYMGEEKVSPSYLLRHISGTLIKDDEDDRKRVKNYLRLIRNKRKNDPAWRELLAGEQWI